MIGQDQRDKRTHFMFQCILSKVCAVLATELQAVEPVNVIKSLQSDMIKLIIIIILLL